MIAIHRLGLVALATTLCLVAFSASAVELEGVGPAVGKHIDSRAIQINRGIYYVSATTILRDAAGDLVSFEELDLPVFAELPQRPNYADYDCSFSAIEENGRPVLKSLRLEVGENG